MDGHMIRAGKRYN